MSGQPHHAESAANRLTRSLARAGLFVGCLLAAPGAVAADEAEDAQQQNNAKRRYWTTDWDFEDVDVGKLLSRLRSIGLDPGVDARGQVTARFEIGIPWNALREAAAYRFDGELTSPRLSIDDTEIRDLRTEVEYRDGVATLSRLTAAIGQTSGAVPAGAIAGEGSVELSPRGDVTAQLRVSDLPLQPFVELAAQVASDRVGLVREGGRASGNVSFRAPLEAIRHIETYGLSGALDWRGVRVAGLPAADVELKGLAIRDGRLTVDALDLAAGSAGRQQPSIRLNGRVDVPLTGRGPFSLDLVGDDLPLAEAVALATDRDVGFGRPIAQGKLDFRVRASGEFADTLEGSRWEVDGAVASPSLRVAGVELGMLEHRLRFTPDSFALTPKRDAEELPSSFMLREITSDYRLTEERFELNSLSAAVFGGRVSGQANLPRDENGELTADLELEGVRPEVRVAVVEGYPAVASATFAGDIDWRVPIAKLSAPSAHRGTAKLSASDIRLGEALVGDFSVEVASTDDSLSLQASGEVFGGSVDVRTIATPQAGDRWSDLQRRLTPARLELDGVSLAPLLRSTIGRDAGLTGEASGRLSLNPNPEAAGGWSGAEASILIDLANVRYGRELLARGVAIEATARNGDLVVRSLTGDYSGGSFRLNGRVNLTGARGRLDPRVDLRLSATRIALARGLWFIGEPAESLAGKVSGTASVSGDWTALRARGAMTGTGLAAYGVRVGDGHSAFFANLEPASLRWDVRLPTISSSVVGGQVKGDLSVASGRRGGFDVASEWDVRRVDFFRLTSDLGQPSPLASGEVSGRLALGGKSVRGVADLAGRYDLELSDTRGAAIPGMVGVSRLLGPVSLATEQFDVGRARGAVRRGVVVVDEFWLGADNALVRADGNVYLTSGRLDLTALVATGDYRDIANNFAQLAQENAIRVLLPASAVLSVTELLRDRTLVVAVTGTVENPVVRPQTIETFREEVARFLLREGQRVILAGAAVGAGDGIE
ncbi:AsmA-like C-terminal region-containing protein [Botrimarina sp.]|uniref:AsmA-like C-terminal region-containing protein n=1 Tax=Botrimarina sp. TaxID=2795802 RepID=UPI0032EBA282